MDFYMIPIIKSWLSLKKGVSQNRIQLKIFMQLMFSLDLLWWMHFQMPCHAVLESPHCCDNCKTSYERWIFSMTLSIYLGNLYCATTSHCPFLWLGGLLHSLEYSLMGHNTWGNTIGWQANILVEVLRCKSSCFTRYFPSLCCNGNDSILQNLSINQSMKIFYCSISNPHKQFTKPLRVHGPAVTVTHSQGNIDSSWNSEDDLFKMT